MFRHRKVWFIMHVGWVIWARLYLSGIIRNTFKYYYEQCFILTGTNNEISSKAHYFRSGFTFVHYTRILLYGFGQPF